MDLTIEGIMSYPTLFKAASIASDPKSDPKFSCSVLVKKGDPQIVEIEKAIEVVKSAKWPKGMPDKSVNYVLVDCRVEYPNEPEFSDYMVVRARSDETRRPVVCDVNHHDIIDPSKVIPGGKCKMAISIFAYTTMRGGVSAGLNGVLVLDGIGDLGKLGKTLTKDQMFGQSDEHASTTSTEPPTEENGQESTEVSMVEKEYVPNVPIMTEKAGDNSYSDFTSEGWTHDQLVDGGYVEMD